MVTTVIVSALRRDSKIYPSVRQLLNIRIKTEIKMAFRHIELNKAKKQGRNGPGYCQ